LKNESRINDDLEEMEKFSSIARRFLGGWQP
jgi:hypothetical protein